MAIEPIDTPLDRVRAEAAAFEDSAFVLRHWRFAASSRGFVWVQPLGDAASVASLAGFLSLFRRCCDAEFPSGVLFDFSRVPVAGEEWTAAFSLIQDFAGQIDARCRVIGAGGRRARAALIYRASKRDELREVRRRTKQAGGKCIEE